MGKSTANGNLFKFAQQQITRGEWWDLRKQLWYTTSSGPVDTPDGTMDHPRDLGVYSPWELDSLVRKCSEWQHEYMEVSISSWRSTPVKLSSICRLGFPFYKPTLQRTWGTPMTSWKPPANWGNPKRWWLDPGDDLAASTAKCGAKLTEFLVGGLVAIFGIFPEILGVCHHPNWRNHIFQRGGEKPPSSNFGPGSMESELWRHTSGWPSMPPQELWATWATWATSLQWFVVC